MVADMYAGVTEPDRVQSFLDGLSAASGSHTTVLIRQNAARPQDNVFLGRDVPSTLCATYDAAVDAPDDKIWFQRSAHVMRTGAVFNGEEWATPREIQRTRYYDEVLRHMDTLHSAAICGLLTPASAIFLTPCRSRRAGPYGTAEMALFRTIAHHWVNACMLKMRLESLQERQVAPGCHQHGLFHLDAELRWIGGNEAAERMVSAGWLSGRHGTRLTGCAAQTEAAWTAMQGRLAHGVESLHARVMPVYDAAGILRAFASVQKYGAATPCRGLPSFVLFVRPLYTSNDDEMAAELRSLFSLTLGESRLALAFRQHGDLRLAASALGLTDASARTRLQLVYEKTGTHKQAELLRMLDALAGMTT